MGAVRKEFSIRNEWNNLELLAEWILDFCRENVIGDDVSHDVRLALEEAVSNTIKYGYDDDRVHSIEVRASLENQRLELVISDDGRPFNPLDVSDPDLSLPVQSRPQGKLGIFLLRSVMDEVEYARRDEKNILRLTKFNAHFQ